MTVILAHNLVRKQKKHVFNEHLELLILIKSGRLEEAVTFFKAQKVPKPQYQRTIYILYDVVEELLKAVKESRNEELLKDVMGAIAIIDKSQLVVIKSEKLEDILMQETERKEEESRSVRHSKRNPREEFRKIDRSST